MHGQYSGANDLTKDFNGHTNNNAGIYIANNYIIGDVQISLVFLKQLIVLNLMSIIFCKFIMIC